MTKEEQEEYNKAVAAGVKALEKEARLRQQLSASLNDYIQGLKDSKTLKETINRNLKEEARLQLELEKAEESKDDQAILNAKLKLDILKKQTAELKKQNGELDSALSSINKKALVGSKATGTAIKGLGKLITGMPNLIKKVGSEIKGLGLWDMDKAMKTSALSIGVLSKQTEGFRSTIKSASWETQKIGVSLEVVSKMQADYSEELGRSVLLSKESLVAMGELAAATSLGAEGAAKMSAEMDTQGLGAQKTRDFVEQTMNDSHKMGLNATKVVKNISGNIKMLNRYNFRDGVKGLAKMAETVSKLGVDMEFASGFADKLWDVEGAVDMSAQLNVMGGEWAKMADPFHLMYMARNDMEGLTKEIGNAAAASAHFNKDGEIQIGAKEMHKLKIIAQQTGVAYDDLVTAGKNAFKLKEIGGQVFAGATDEEKEFLSNMAEMKDGKATVMVKGSPKLVSQIDKGTVQALMKEKESLKERAKNAQTFDEALTNTINGMKQFLLPIVEVINAELIPRLEGFVKRFEDGKWGEKIEKFATMVGTVISTIGGFIIDNPLMSAAIYFGTKLTGFLLDKLSWLANGVLLAKGFNSMASVGGGGGGDGAADEVEGVLEKFGKKLFNQKSTGAAARTGKGMLGNFKGGLKSAGGIGAGVLAGGLAAWSEWSENSEKGMGTGENVGRTTSKGVGAGLGAWGGAAAGAAIGSAVPIVGTIIGGLIGGAIGAWGGGALGEAGGDAMYGDEDRALNDGIIGSPVHDARFNSSLKQGIFDSFNKKAGKPLGPDFSKKRGVIQGGKITPIDNKDDLLAMKPGGVVDSATKDTGSNMVNHSFGDININGKIMVEFPGGTSHGEDLLNDPQFRRDIARVVTTEIQKTKIGGKPKG